MFQIPENLKMGSDIGIISATDHDLDIQYGKMREKKILDMFFNKKFEIKSEIDWW